MTFAEVREEAGKVWGATTTTLLGLGTQIDPILRAADPEVAQALPWLKYVIFGGAVGMVVLRFLAPPPPSVPIHLADAVSIENNAVTIVKANTVPAGITDKAPGEKM